MAYKDLREFIAALENQGELRRVAAEVDPCLEMTQIADRICKRGGPALLFENPKGSDPPAPDPGHRRAGMPVLMNAFGSARRMAMALGVTEVEEIAERIRGLLEVQPPRRLKEKLTMLPKLGELLSYVPKTVRRAPCKEVVMDDPSLDVLPILKCWPEDGGRFITLPLVFTQDPRTGARNVGIYRMQVYDSKTTGLHWHPQKGGAEHSRLWRQQGERMPVAVALGGDPATIYAASAPVPNGLDELLFAGFLRREPVEVVKCRTVPLEVPAHSEIVIEGYVDAEETRLEGPFGDHTGYYSAADHYPVLHVTCITHRTDAIYPATVVGKPPMEDCYLAKATERIFLPLIQLQLPEIVDINLPIEGVFHNVGVISIRKSYAGQARKVMNAVWGLGQMMFTKIIVVVDEDVNVHDLGEVLWRLGNNIDPRRDVLFTEGPVDVLNHASPEPNFGSKMGIDATRKLPEEGHPRRWPADVVMRREIVELVQSRWREYGLESPDE
jgi:4-hydroxy-3-polyprenylbenzoate decarboxylase